MSEIVVWQTAIGGATGKVWLKGDLQKDIKDPKKDVYRIASLQLLVSKNGNEITGGFNNAGEVLIPADIVIKEEGIEEGDSFRFLTWHEATQMPDAERRDLCKKLTDLRESFQNKKLVLADFLGITNIAGVNTTFELELDVDGIIFGAAKAEAPVFKARGSATFDAGFSSPFGGANLTASVILEVALTREAILDLIPRIEIPVAPHLAIRWPRVPLVSFSLSAIDLSNLDRMFDLPLPALAGHVPLRFQWTTPPKITLDIKDGSAHVTATTRGEGQLVLSKVDGAYAKVSEVSGIGIEINQRAVSVTGNFQSGTSKPLPVLDELELPSSVTGPFFVRIFKVEIGANVAAGAGALPKLDAALSIGRCEVRARTDPLKVIAVTATIAFTIENGQLSSRLTRLDLIEPYPFRLIAAAAHVIDEESRKLWSLIQRIPIPDPNAPSLPGVLTVLRRLGELVESAARWFGEQGLAGARGLAGLAEAAMKVIADVISKLAEDIGNSAKRICDAVVIELRVDMTTWRLVQVVVTPVGNAAPQTPPPTKQFLGLKLSIPYELSPALMYDLEHQWLALVLQTKTGASATLSTDLWLEGDNVPAEPTSGAPAEDKPDNQPLISIEVKPKTGLTLAIMVVEQGKAKFFQKLVTSPIIAPISTQVPEGHGGEVVGAGHLLLGTSIENPEALSETDVEIKPYFNTDRVLSFFRSAKPGTDGDGQTGLLDKLNQYIKVTSSGDPQIDWKTGSIAFDVAVEITILETKLDTKLALSLSLETLSASIHGDTIKIAPPKSSFSILGLDAEIVPATGKTPPDFRPLEFCFKDNNPRLQLATDARINLSYGKLSSDGRGLKFEVDTFVVARDGIDLLAKIKDDPVTLAGVDMPFRFDTGSLSVKRSTVQAFSLRGHGNLPPALVGEAKASITLNFSQHNGRITLQACEAVLDKSGDPLRCEATRFTITISKLGLKFVEQGGYHFYFTLTGTAQFRPNNDEFSSGLLKNLANLKIVLDEAPLAADPRVLLQHIEFQIPVEPPKRTNFFDIFAFELRGVGFHPAAPAFGGTPAFSISGQVNFTDFGDVVTPRFDFHKMWIAPAGPGQSLPRLRFDGLGVGLKIGAAADVYGTAIAVDGSISTLLPPEVAPSNVTGKGFLASGSVQIKGWASMSASMGFLELEKQGVAEKRHAFFMYIQENDLAVKIPTPIGSIFLREVGFGFGFRYTLAGLAAADTATTPRQLVKLLDEVSKYAGDLDKVQAWAPTYDNDNISLALRGMLSLTAASSSGSYNEVGEAELPNLVLLDIVAALRTDLTFLMNVRLWVAYNYNDWRKARTSGDSSWKQRPSLRGYMYLSAPRSEFLARAVFDPDGPIGDHPKLPDVLKKAMQAVRWSSTLYIRPGLFHMEFGWPYELGFNIGEENSNFFLVVEGGTVLRFEDLAMLYGLAFRARGHASFTADTGGDFGAAVTAYAGFALSAKLIAYLSAQISESMFYGEITLDLTLRFSVRIWLHTRFFSVSAGFSTSIAVHIAVELVFAPAGLSGRVEASVSVSAFGCSLTLGIGFAIGNPDLLADARARVARFLSLGLGVDYPDPEHGVPVSRPLPEPSPGDNAKSADKRVQNIADQREAVAKPNEPPVSPDELLSVLGEAFYDVHYWAILFPVASTDGKDYYLVQLLPRGLELFSDETPGPRSHFYAAPVENGGCEYRLTDDAGSTDIATKWNRQFGLPDPADSVDRRPTLRDFFEQGCFVAQGKATNQLSGKDEDYLLTDVESIQWRDYTLSSDPEALNRAVADAAHSRRDLGVRRKRMQQVDEARSCFIVTVAQCAEELARRIIVDAPEKSNLHDEALNGPEFDPRALGLTFIKSKADINKLFPGNDKLQDPDKRGPIRSHIFTISTRLPKVLGPGEAPSFCQATPIALLNPPKRMFQTASPRLADIETRVLANGIQLYWDLEPAWGASIGVYDDPEYHLKHYRIERHVVGIDRPPAPRITTVKAAHIIHFNQDQQGQQCRTRLRSRLQFVDDLSDLPVEVRANLLPPANANDRQDAGQGLSESVHINYVIVPVDIAGTAGVATPVNVKIEPAPPIEDAILRAVARFDYGARMPGLELWKPADPTKFISFFIEEDGRIPEAPTEPPVVKNPPKGYRLRLCSEPTVAAGVFGADALSQARAEPAPPERGTRPGANDFECRLLPPESGSDKVIKVAVRRLPKSLPNRPAPKAEEDVFILEADWDEFLRKLGVSASGAVRATRLYIAPEPKPGPDPKEIPLVTGEWIPVQMQIRIGTANETDPAPVDITVERFEHPTDVRFQAIHMENMSTDSGGLYLYHPLPCSAFRDFVEQMQDAVQLCPDGDRRTCVELRWNVRPTQLAALGDNGQKIDEPDNTLGSRIGGFDVFAIDTSAVPKGQEALPYATSIARVQRMPESGRGQDPAETGDFARVEALYPSDTYRLGAATRSVSRYSASVSGEEKAVSGTKRRAGWYSPAESFLVWPRRVMRRSVLTLPDEVELAKLFERARPTRIDIRWKGWPDLKEWQKLWSDIKAMPAPGFALADGKPDADADGYKIDQMVEISECPASALWYIVRKGDETAALTVDLVRRALLSLVLTIEPPSELDEKAATLPASFLVNTKIELTAWWEDKGDKEAKQFKIGSATMEPHLLPDLHPALADVMDLIRYAVVLDGQTKETIYRRYEPVLEAPPPVNAKSLTGFLDDTSADRDPAGWGILRTFGLAASFRLFDRETGNYCSGDETLGHLNEVLKVVLPRYQKVKDALGAPFVDVMATADGLAELISFHGSAPMNANANRRVRRNALALVQFELRPAVRQVASEETGKFIVRYAKLMRRLPEFVDDKIQIGDDGKPKIPAAGKITVAAALDQVLVEILPAAPTTGGLDNSRYLMLRGWETDFPDEAKRKNQGRFPYGGSESVSSSVTFAPVNAARYTAAAETTKKGAHLPDDVGLLGYVRLVALTQDGQLADLDKVFIEVKDPIEVEVNDSIELCAVDDPAEDPVAWGRFGDLPASWLAALLFGDGLTPDGGSPDHKYPAARATLEAVVRALGRRSLQPGAPDPAQISDRAQKRLELAGRLGEWSRRFMEHGPYRYLSEGKAGLALSILTRPSPWRVAPDPEDGRLSILLFEKDRYGKTRKYAIKPFGRYDNLAQAVCAQELPDGHPDKAEKISRWAELARPSLSHAGTFGTSSNPLLTHFVDAVTQRIEPIAAPVILAAQRKDIKGRDDQQEPRDSIEIIISRHPEEILADANIRTDAGIAMRHLALGLWREFAAPHWASRVTRDGELEAIDLLEPFGPFSKGASPKRRQLQLPRSLVLDENGDIEVEDVRELYEQHPDLWRGAYVIRVSDMPHGFRFHAAAHVAAGVVVSPSSVASIEGADFQLSLPWKKPEDEKDKVVSAAWQDKPVEPPGWKVERNDTTRTVAISVSWPLVRLVDGLQQSARKLWLGFDDAPALYRLPDPDVSYRLTIDSEDGTARVPEAEFSPIPDTEKHQGNAALYLAQKIGQRFDAPVIKGVTLIRNDHDVPTHYRIDVGLELESAPEPVAPTIAFGPHLGPDDVKPGDLSVQDLNSPWWQIAPMMLRQDGKHTIDATITPPHVEDPRPSLGNPHPTPAREWVVFKQRMEQVLAQYQPFLGEERSKKLAQMLIDRLRPFAVDRVAHWPGQHQGNFAAQTKIEFDIGAEVWLLGLPLLERSPVGLSVGETAAWLWPTKPAVALDKGARHSIADLFSRTIDQQMDPARKGRLEHLRDAVIVGMQKYAAAKRRAADEMPFAGLSPVNADIPSDTQLDTALKLSTNDPVDLIAEVELVKDPGRTAAKVDAAFDELEDVANAGMTLDALAALRAAPDLKCLLPFLWSAQTLVLSALAELVGAHVPGKAIRLLVRKPATKSEADAFQGAHKELPRIIDHVTTTMVLGPRRRLMLHAFHGLKKPVMDEIKRSEP